MALYNFRMPDIGEGIAEAEVVAWHAGVGDWIEADAPLADAMTDKATITIESPVSGRIVSLACAEGERIAIGATLAGIETGAEAPNPAAQPVASPAPSPPVPPRTPPQPSPAPASQGPRVLASPAVRARAKALGIDLALVQTTEGRIRHADLDAYLLYHRAEGYHAPHTSRARPDELVRITGLRRRIAENMAAAKAHIPHFTYVEEVDVTRLEALRAELNAGRGERPKLTVPPFLIAAICGAVPAFPMINARYDDEAGIVTRHGHVHMGLATHTEAGLLVPVIRDAQDRNLWQLAAEIARLAEAARNGRVRPEELSGSTITLSSLGPLGGIAATPIINRPEVAIIATGRIVTRPVFAGDKVVPAKLMNLSISCDHRVVDGFHAANFIAEVKRLLETPALLL